VVFSGGEPTAQGALEAAIRQAHDMGFKVGLHTAGPYPRRLQRVLPYVSWVGFDVKTAFDCYTELTGAAGSGEATRRSLRALLASGVPHEVRTTVHAKLVSGAALLELAAELASLGVRRYVLQEFRAHGCSDAELSSSPPGDCAELGERLGAMFDSFELRRASADPAS